ncbi:beta strand repeat-containing protein, partial [Campylobacter fetus]|uniref:beta strand repeat-containing protein n=1 Tax=Campylobacter fetus TaxID=196 RepID=UPI001659BFFB
EGTTSKLISEITSASDLDKVKGEIDGLKESIDEAGLNKIALTTENDTITGTEGGDLISGVVGTAAESTLNPGDKIDGGAGNDVLKVDLKGNFDGFKGDGYIKNVEKLELSNTTSIGRSFNAKDVAGLKTVALNSEKGIEVKNLANIVDVELTNLKADKFSIDAMYANKVLDSASGVKDTQNLKVNGVGTKDKAVALTADKIEVLNLNTIGEASFLKDVNVENVSVKGSANLSLATGAKTTTLDASSFGGALDADLSASDKLNTVKGGNGNDKITIGTSVANVNVDGGAGNDELVIKGTGALKPTVANVEKVTVEAVGGALTLAMNNATGVTELDVKQATGGAITITNSAIETVSFVNNDNATNTVTVNNAGLNTVNFKGGNDKGAATTVKGNITAVKSESLTVNTDALSTIAKADAVINAANATNISINAEKGTAGMTLTAGKLTDLTVNNKGDFELVGVLNGLNNVENLTVASEGKFSITTSTTLNKVGNIALSGKEIDLANQTIGSETLSSLAVEVSELSGDLKLGGAIKAKGDINVNLNSINTATLGAITSSTGNASVIISSATGAVTLGAVSAVNGNVTLNAGNALGAVTLGAIAGDIVSIDLGGVLGTINSGNKVSITSNEVTYIGSEISKNEVEITAAAVGGTDLDAQMIGGAAADDSLTLIADASTQKITAKGDLSGGETTLDLTGASSLAVIDLSDLKNSTVAKIDLDGALRANNTIEVEINGSDAAETLSVTINNADITAITLSGDLGGGANHVDVIPNKLSTEITTIDLGELEATGGTLTSTITIAAELTKVTTVKGSAGDDTVTFAQNTEDVTIDLGAGDDTFIGAKLADGKSVTVTGGEGNDTFNLIASVVSGATKADFTTITDFSNGDKITFAASSVAGYVNAGSLSSTGTLATDFATFASSHDTAKTVYGFTYNNESYLFYNAAGSTAGIAVGDIIVKLAGTAGTVDLGSISLNSDTGVTIA